MLFSIKLYCCERVHLVTVIGLIVLLEVLLSVDYEFINTIYKVDREISLVL